MNHRSLLMTILCALACQARATEQDSATGRIDRATIATASVLRPAIMLNCGDHEVTLRYGGDSTIAIIDGERVTLRRTVADTATREVAISDSTTYVLRQDSTTRVSVKGRDLGACIEQSVPPFVARGHEPGWVLRIVDDRITYIGNYGEDTVASSVASVTTTGRATTYITQPPSKLTVVVVDTACADGATGMPHPYSVRVTHDTANVNGCGGEPSSLLTGEQWTVTDVRGTPMTQSPPTMTFTRAGRVVGSTSCNRYSGPYRLSGEGLRFGPMVSTKMACAEPRMTQESTFLQGLATVTRFEHSPNRVLRLLADDGQAIVARRQ